MKTVYLLIILALAGCSMREIPPEARMELTPSDKEILRPYLGGFPDSY